MSSWPVLDSEPPIAFNARHLGKPGNAAACRLHYESAGELELLSAAQSGDQHAFVELCRRYGPHLKHRIRRIVRNFEDAEDVFQETLMSAFQHLSGFRAQASFRTWIMRIATNTSLMLLRRRRSRPEGGFGIVTAEGKEFDALQVADRRPGPEQLYARRQSRQRLSQAIGSLPPGIRLLLEQYYDGEVALVDAAQAMGMTVAAAKTRLFRARKALRRRLRN